MNVGGGDNKQRRGFIDRLLNNPGALATLVIAVLGQALFSIIFQVINNEQQEARIAANAQSLIDFKAQVNNLQTPLSQHVFKLEDLALDLRKALDELAKRLDTVDVAGTRALSLVSANQQRVMSQVDRLGDRLIMQDKVIAETNSKSAVISPLFQQKLDEITRNISRLEDQQRRIIEALDNLYSTVSKIPPVLKNKKPND